MAENHQVIDAVALQVENVIDSIPACCNHREFMINVAGAMAHYTVSAQKFIMTAPPKKAKAMQVELYEKQRTMVMAQLSTLTLLTQSVMATMAQNPVVEDMDVFRLQLKEHARAVMKKSILMQGIMPDE